MDGFALPIITAKPATVRLATPQDEDAIFDLLVALYKDNDIGLPYRPEIVRERIRIGTEHRGGIIGVIDGKDRIDASIGLFVEPAAWFTDAMGLRELWLFVRPEARKGTMYWSDLFSFLSWARSSMARDLARTGYPLPFPALTSVVSTHRLEAKARLWRRMAKPIGHIFSVSN